MNSIKIKPLTVNQAWKGKRYKTDKYIKYIDDIYLLLPKIKIPDGFLELDLKFGFSSKVADFDNPVKPFVDCLQLKYGFNDRRIRKCTIETFYVDKGCEFIEFEFQPYKNIYMDG